MTMHAATVLRFVKFPGVSNRPQQTVDGRAWQIVRIEAPFCLGAASWQRGPLRQYLVEGEQSLRAATWPLAPARPGGGPEPEAVSAPMPAPRERDDQRLYRKPRGKVAFLEIGRSAIASGVLAPPD